MGFRWSFSSPLAWLPNCSNPAPLAQWRGRLHRNTGVHKLGPSVPPLLATKLHRSGLARAMARQAAWDSAYAQMGFSWSFSSPFAWLPNCSDFGPARAMAWRGARENAYSQTTLKASGMHTFHHSPLFLGSFCFVYPLVANFPLKVGAAHGLVYGRTLL